MPNPMNPQQISRIKLNPQVIECIVFWSKNPMPLLQRLGDLDAYKFYFQYSINSYDHDIEPGLPALDDRIETFQRLSRLLGPERVIWRYDPILLSSRYSLAWHTDQYSQLAEKLAPYTRQCIISFVDSYPKKAKQMKQADINTLDDKQVMVIAQIISKTAAKYNLKVSTCSEKIDLSGFNINHAGCIDRELIEYCTGMNFAKANKDKNQRPECGCISSVDIGIYNTCIYGCTYCYANFNASLTRKKHANHDPESPILTGNMPVNAIIRDREIQMLGLADK